MHNKLQPDLPFTSNRSSWPNAEQYSAYGHMYVRTFTIIKYVNPAGRKVHVQYVHYWVQWF